MISGLFTIAAIIGFIGVCWWAYTRHNRARFEEAARLPLDDDQPASGSATSTQKTAPCCCKPQTGARVP